MLFVYLPAGVVCAAVAAVVSYLTWTPMYEASAWLSIKGIRPFLAFESSYDERAAEAFVKTQVETIRSPLVMGPVMADEDSPKLPELAKVEDPIAWLGKHIDVSSVGQSELFKISLTCSEPKAVATVVNLVVDQFFELNQQEGTAQTQEVITLLNREMADRTDEVTRLRENVRTLAIQAGAKDPFAVDADKDTSANYRLSELQLRLTDLELEQELLKARIEARKAIMQRSEVSQGADQHIVEKHEPEGTLARRQQELAAMELETEESQIMADSFRKRYDEKLTKAQKSSGNTLDLQFKQAELARAEEVLDLISERILKLRTEQRAPSRVTLMQLAVAPTSPIEEIPYRRMATAAIIALLAPFLLGGAVISFRWLRSP